MGKHGFGAVSPQHNARHFSDTQRPLRQLLSGNSGQARGGGFPKSYGLGGGAHMKACTIALCQQACRCSITPCGYAQPRPALWPACESCTLRGMVGKRSTALHTEMQCVTYGQCHFKAVMYAVLQADTCDVRGCMHVNQWLLYSNKLSKYDK